MSAIFDALLVLTACWAVLALLGWVYFMGERHEARRRDQLQWNEFDQAYMEEMAEREGDQ